MDVLVYNVSLFFAARIEETARQFGGRAVLASAAAPLLKEIERVRPDLVLLELERCDLDEVRALRAREDLRGVRVYGFGAHVQRELFEAARAAGFDDVVAKGELARRLAGWMDEE